jgi:hypothetical protein
MRNEGGDLQSVVFAPKADGVLALNGKGTISQWQLDNPHPEVTLKTVFGKVWYEGYSQPEYVWQSTGGTDDFEAKFSLTPLIFGTIKGTVYALLIAVPLALLGALYVSEFMHPTVKGYVKPVIEVMAALPSVVLGFLAGLWLVRAGAPVPGAPPDGAGAAGPGARGRMACGEWRRAPCAAASLTGSEVLSTPWSWGWSGAASPPPGRLADPAFGGSFQAWLSQTNGSCPTTNATPSSSAWRWASR